MQICDSNIFLKDQDAIFGALLNCLTLIDLFETLPSVNAVVDSCAESLDEEGFVFLRSDLGKLFKTPLQFRLARTSSCHTGQIAVTILLKGTFEELP